MRDPLINRNKLSRKMRDPLINWSPYFFESCFSGLGLGVLLIVLVFNFIADLALHCNLLDSLFTNVNMKCFYLLKKKKKKTHKVEWLLMLKMDFRKKDCMGVCHLGAIKLIWDSRHCQYNFIYYQHEVY